MSPPIKLWYPQRFREFQKIKSFLKFVKRLSNNVDALVIYQPTKCNILWRGTESTWFVICIQVSIFFTHLIIICHNNRFGRIPSLKTLVPIPRYAELFSHYKVCNIILINKGPPFFAMLFKRQGKFKNYGDKKRGGEGEGVA